MHYSQMHRPENTRHVIKNEHLELIYMLMVSQFKTDKTEAVHPLSLSSI